MSGVSVDDDIKALILKLTGQVELVSSLMLSEFRVLHKEIDGLREHISTTMLEHVKLEHSEDEK